MIAHIVSDTFKCMGSHNTYNAIDITIDLGHFSNGNLNVPNRNMFFNDEEITFTIRRLLLG